MIDQFSRTVTNLTGRVRIFGTSIANENPQLSAKVVASEADSCEALLEQISLCAEQQDVNLDSHYTQFVIITDGLKVAKSNIQQKIEHADWDERSDFMSSLGSVNAALKIVFGLTSKTLRKRRFVLE